MSLYHKYRPSTFEEIIGNETTVDSLSAAISSKVKDRTHAILLSGQTGCGKTTLARIVANELGCVGSDFREIDSADFRGIDSIREIRKQAGYKPLEGSCRVWLLDECFAAGTEISIPKGQIFIEDIEVGDTVYSLAGKDEVERVFKNKVVLPRVLKLQLSNGNFIYTTKQHKFLTSKGWICAEFLNKKDLLFGFNSNIMANINLLKETKDEDLCMVQQRIQRKKNNTTDMFTIMCGAIKESFVRFWKIRNPNMSILRKRIHEARILPGSFLFPKLCRQVECGSSWTNGENAHSRSTQKNEHPFKENVGKSRISAECCEPNENQKSNEHATKYKQNDGNQKNQRNTAGLERYSWGEWAFDTIANTFINCIRVANRICRFFREKAGRIPNKLQNRYCKSCFTIGNRGRWETASVEKKYNSRCEKNKETKRIRVENIEVYKRGNNDESFRGIINNKERDQGYVTFFDLQMKKHPSYFANSIPVHNCHALSRDAMNALLKALEDPQPHVYYILATTEPQKLIPTIRGRCSIFPVSLLDDGDMMKLLRRVVKAEEASINKNLYYKIIEKSQGHPRNALQILESVLSVSDEQRETILKEMAATEIDAIELCRALIKGAGWKMVSGLLTKLKKEEPESIRRMILAYCTTILLKKENIVAASIMEAMLEPFYNTNFPGLVFACFSVVCAKEEE